MLFKKNVVRIWLFYSAVLVSAVHQSVLTYIRVCVCVCVCSVAQSCLALCGPMDCSLPCSFCPWKFSRQKYWSGLLFPTPGGLPVPGVEPESLVSPALTGRLFTTEPLGKPHICTYIPSFLDFLPL